MPHSIHRRRFLEAARFPFVLTATRAICQTWNRSGRIITDALRSAALIGNWLVEWQSPYGSTDLEKCPHRTPGLFNTVQLLPNEPANRALYKLYEATGIGDYKAAADRYVTLLFAAIHDPVTPYVNWTMLNGHAREYLSTAWLYGDALSSYASFRRYNPKEDCFELRAYSMYRALQRHRRSDSYYGAGYPSMAAPDAQSARDLAQVGSGLVKFYEISNYSPALDDALGLARFFLTEWQEGSGRGVWSSTLGTWLASPWLGTDAREFANRPSNHVASVSTVHMIAAEFLLPLYSHATDTVVREAIADKCRSALDWIFRNCQFDDGAVGLFGRDDKWMGMTASVLLLYLALEKKNLIPVALRADHRKHAETSWRWIASSTKRDTFPADGYVRIANRSEVKPAENLVAYMCPCVEALVDGGSYFR